MGKLSGGAAHSNTSITSPHYLRVKGECYTTLMVWHKRIGIVITHHTKGANLGQVGGILPGVPEGKTARPGVPSGEEKKRNRSQGER